MKKKSKPVIIGLVLLIAAVFIFHRFLLQETADFLFIKSNPQKSDVIIVLGGEIKGGRTEKAVQLYQEGYAPRLLFSDGTDLSWRVKSIDEMVALAQSLKVPNSAIFKEQQSLSTYENAVYTKQIMLAHEWKSAIVVTTGWHTRRSRFVFEKVYRNTGIHLTYSAAPDKENKDYTNWWKDSEKRQVILTEWSKLLVYTIQYGFK